MGLSLDSVLVSGCLGSEGLAGVSVIETIGGNSGEGSTGIGIGSLGRNDGGDSGNRMLAGSSTTMDGGSYCSIDEYSRRCCPYGTRGKGGIGTQDGSMGGSGMTSLGRDDDGRT